MSWNPVRREDRAMAERAAAAINAYWRARGVEANARVAADGSIVSDLGTGKNGKAAGKAIGGEASKGSAVARELDRRLRPRAETRGLAEIRRAAIVNYLTRAGAHGATLTELAALTKAKHGSVAADLDDLHRRAIVSARQAGARKIWLARGCE